MRDDCGKIVGLVPLKNKLCVLFEYGISMIEVSGGARSFVRKDVCYGEDKILLGSACVGNVDGERAYFLTRSGVCRFDGVKVEKTGENLTVESAEEDCTCAFAFGQYFVAYTLFRSNKKRTIAIDAESGKGYETATVNGLFGNNTTAIGVCGNTVYTLAKDGVLPSGQEAVFAVQTDFGVQGVKTVRKMRFAGEGTFTITLANGQKSWRREIQFVDGRAEVRLAMRGENFALSIQPKGGCEISELRVSIQTLSGVK